MTTSKDFFLKGHWKVTKAAMQGRPDSPNSPDNIPEKARFLFHRLGKGIACTVTGAPTEATGSWEAAGFSYDARHGSLVGILYFGTQSYVVELTRWPDSTGDEIQCSYHKYEHDHKSGEPLLTDAGYWHGTP